MRMRHCARFASGVVDGIFEFNIENHFAVLLQDVSSDPLPGRSHRRKRQVSNALADLIYQGIQQLWIFKTSHPNDLT